MCFLVTSLSLGRQRKKKTQLLLFSLNNIYVSGIMISTFLHFVLSKISDEIKTVYFIHFKHEEEKNPLILTLVPLNLFVRISFPSTNLPKWSILCLILTFTFFFFYFLTPEFSSVWGNKILGVRCWLFFLYGVSLSYSHTPTQSHFIS